MVSHFALVALTTRPDGKSVNLKKIYDKEGVFFNFRSLRFAIVHAGFNNYCRTLLKYKGYQASKTIDIAFLPKPPPPPKKRKTKQPRPQGAFPWLWRRLKAKDWPQYVAWILSDYFESLSLPRSNRMKFRLLNMLKTENEKNSRIRENYKSFQVSWLWRYPPCKLSLK